MKITIKLSFLIVAVFLYSLPNQFALAASTQASFQKDVDWSAWVRKDVELLSSQGGAGDSGLALKKTSAGNYELSGAAIYKISPDGLATWGEMTSVKSIPAGTNINFSFSSSEISIDQSYSDVRARGDVRSNPNEIGMSDFLFIRIDFTASVAGGVGTVTPTLSSFGLNYTVVKNPNIYTEKHIYRYLDSDPVKLLETATFTPGMMATVKIKLSATNASNMSFKAQDYLARSAETVTQITNIDDAVKYCNLNKATDTLLGSAYSYTAGADSVTFDAINLDGVSGYLCYTYLIPSPTNPQSKWQTKNDVQQIRLNVSSNDLILATSSNYIMVRGFAYQQSDSASTLTNLLPIDDELLFSFDKFIFKGLSGQDISYTSAPSYIYKRGIAAKSRGGNLYNLPVNITDKSGGALLSTDSFYLLYNPSVYVMGNLFSKNSLPDASLDFGSKNNVVSGTTFDGTNKLNAQAGLYNYSIDQSSVSYWNSTSGQPKSKAMQINIDRIIGTPGHRPENFCDMGSDTSSLANGKLLYLNNENCQINIAGTSNIWPDGRVWYFKPTGDVDLSATVKFRGTMVFDFGSAQSSNVRIGTVAADFASDANGEKSLGIILINGGNAVFTKTADTFNGMVFVPGA